MSSSIENHIYSSRVEECFDAALEMNATSEAESTSGNSSDGPVSQQLHVIVNLDAAVYPAPQPFLPLPSPTKELRTERFLFKPKSLVQRRHPPYEYNILQRLSQSLAQTRRSSSRGARKKQLRRLWRKPLLSEQFQRFRKSVISFAFEHFAGHPKVQDDTLMRSIAMFDTYYQQKLEPLDYIAGKELVVAAIVLTSKTENVRHLSIKVASQISGLEEAAVIENERKLFLLFNTFMNSPSVCCFIKAILEQPNIVTPSCSSDGNVRTLAYHLAIYIFALNTVEDDCLTISPEVLGNACVYVAALLLRFHSKIENVKELAHRIDNEDYCLQLMCRALQGCQVNDSPINVHFSTSERCCVRHILLSAFKTPIGQYLAASG